MEAYKVKVSVIIPVYNSEKYLREALNGVVNQTRRDIEIICVDDGSTDSSVDILKEYASKDNRIKILYQTEKSNGAALARNMGIKSAKGEYLSILDSDDIFEPDLLECSIAKAEQTGADVVLYDGFFYDSKTQVDRYLAVLLNRTYLYETNVFSPHEKQNCLFEIFANAAWLMLIRRDFIIENEIWFRPVHYSDDIEFSNLALAEARRIAILKRRMVHYRYNAEKNQSEDRWKDPESVYKTFYYFREQLIRRGLYETYRVSYVRKMLAYVIGALDTVENKEVFIQLYKSLRGGFLEELGAFDIQDDEIDESLKNKRDWILKNTYEDYLFQISRNQLAPIAPPEFYLPICLRKNIPVKVILYGAGKMGRVVYASLLNECDIELVCWMDREGDKMMSKTNVQIISPKCLKNYNYDAIFVAVKKKDVFAEIKQELLCLGARDLQVVWAFGQGGL